MKKNEKTIYLSQFEAKVEDGPVKFLVLDAKYEEIPTKNGKKEIVKIELELEELDKPESNKEVKSINLFVDYNPRGLFFKFVNSALTSLATISFQPSTLVGMKGVAVLSHYTPKRTAVAYALLNACGLSTPNKIVAEALVGYQNDNDIDFKSDEDGAKN